MRYLLLFAMLLTLAPGLARADSMRCGDRIVSTEALAGEVIAICGAPDYRDTGSSGPYGGDEESWTYNFGSNQLIQVLHLRNGRITRIDTDGYGFEPGPTGACRPLDIVHGLSTYRLVTRCGAPATRESFGILRPLRRADGTFGAGSAAPVYRERWVYDLGPQYLLQIVTLENGRVADVESGPRGRATPRD